MPSLIRAGMLLVAASCCARADTDQQRVLLLSPYGHNVTPFSTLVDAFRTTLARESELPIDFYEVPLDLARFAGVESEDLLVDFLVDRIGMTEIDLIAPFGSAGASFALRNRDRLHLDAPILLTGASPRFFAPELQQTDVTMVAQRVNLPGMVEDILQLQPSTTNIVVIFGSTELERIWLRECQREFAPFAGRVGFTYIDELPLPQILDQCSKLPPRSAILHTLFVADAAGVPCQQGEALRRLHETANAPLFGYFQSEFGQGPIGGRLYQDEMIGREAARMAVRIVQGEHPRDIPPLIYGDAAPVYDWRELQRWNILESALPAGSVVHFRQPNFWEQYRRPIGATISLCVLQTALIVALVVNRGTRIKAEAAARQLSGQLMNAHEENYKELARELHDDVTQRLARMAIDAGKASGDAGEDTNTGALRALRDGLVHLSENIHNLSYRLHPSILEDLGLAEALKAECAHCAREAPAAFDVCVEELPTFIPPTTAIGLYRIAQGALRNAVLHSRARRVEVTLRRLDKGLQLAVVDDGIGFVPSAHRTPPSLGLASMRERARLLGGELDVESEPGRGTAIVAWAPLKGDAS